ncbi:hypothetical protein [Mucilaginibacter sp. HD30]
MQFKNDFNSEQLNVLHEVIREGRTYSDVPKLTFTSQGAFINEPGQIDLTLDNYFETDDLKDFRCLDTFCDYIIRFDYSDFEPFKKLFQLMYDRVSFNVSFHLGANVIEVFIPFEGKEEPEYIDIVYHPAFYMFLKLYTEGHINIKVTSDQLLEKICDFTGYVKIY